MISLQVGGDLNIHKRYGVLAPTRGATTLILVNEMNVDSLPEY
jgi:hypothetical protein